jgi:hypothetical protein
VIKKDIKRKKIPQLTGCSPQLQPLRASGRQAPACPEYRLVGAGPSIFLYFFLYFFLIVFFSQFSQQTVNAEVVCDLEACFFSLVSPQPTVNVESVCDLDAGM